MRFDSYHPLINALFFVVVIVCSLVWDQPIFAVVSFATSFAYSLWLGRTRALAFNLAMMVLGVVYAAWFAFTSHFGVTVLGVNFIGNAVTLEAVAFGLSQAARMVAALMWVSCLLQLFTADKTVYLLGRIAPRVALFMAILLRAVLRIANSASAIARARTGVGKGLGQGGPAHRIRNWASIVSCLVSFSIDSFAQASDSMRARGSNLHGRTAYSLYRFDHRDRTLVLWMTLLFTIMLCGVLLNQTNILYAPAIAMGRITAASFAFYGAYALFCLMPMGLEIVGRIRFARARQSVRQEGASHTKDAQ